MYPEWRRILEIDSGRLADVGLLERPYPLSAVLRMRSDHVADESGYGAFTDAVRGDVVDRAQAASTEVAVADVHWVLGQLREPLMAERAALADPSAAGRLTADVESARQRLADLKRADAAWSARLDDEFAALGPASPSSSSARCVASCVTPRS